MPRQHLRILAVNTHPHDFTHYAGTLGIHTSLGDSVTVVSMTSGAHTHNEKLADELRKPAEERDPSIMDQSEGGYAATKERELRDACAVFGITDVRLLNYPQPFRLTKSEDAIETLRDIILEVRPHIMITQSPYLIGRNGMVAGTRDDHSETAYASLEAQQLAAVATYGATVPPHRIAVTYFPGVYFERDQYDFLVDISDWFEQRVQAEALFVSQGHTPEGSRQRITLTTGATGFAIGVRHAEAFVREKPELLPQLVVSEAALRSASESYHNRVRRRLGEHGEGA